MIREVKERENCYKMMLLNGAKDAETLNFYRKAGYSSSVDYVDNENISGKCEEDADDYGAQCDTTASLVNCDVIHFEIFNPREAKEK